MLISPRKSSASLLMLVSILTIMLFFTSCSSSKHSNANEEKYNGRIHTVSRGETLFSIAWRYGVDLKKLAAFNDIKPPYTIYPSQKIRLDIANKNAKVSSSSATPKSASSNRNDATLVVSDRSKKEAKNSYELNAKGEIQGPLKWQWPSSGKLIASFQGDSGFNKGIDLSGKLGEPVLAAASGRVVYAGSGLSGYGKLLIIKHNEIFLSAYAHNNQLLVKEGDFIKGGQRIADMGSSGTDRVKLHFEIRSDGSPVDPLKYLPKRP